MAKPGDITKELGILREKIDEVDEKILKLLNRRASLVRSVGNVKNKGGGGEASRTILYRPDREGVILRKLREKNPGPFPADSIEPVYREIISACRSLEIRLQVAYLGPEATYTHRAARQYFGHRADYHPMTNVEEVFESVERSRFDFGVVPIENSTGGTIAQALDLFVDTDLIISGNVELKISHNLYSKSGKIANVKKVYSHAQGLAQSWKWIRQNLPNAKPLETSSTGEAARRAAVEPDSAAIAGQLAGERYKLKAIAEGIEDYHQNFTRFLVIGRTEAGITGKDRTSLLLSLKDEPGILYKALEPFARRDINMSKIESRPLKRKAWEYLFFIDIDGHAKEAKIAETIAEIQQYCLFVKVLGSYPL